MSKKRVNNTIVCVTCETRKAIKDNYYMSSIPFFKQNRLPVCKACIATELEKGGFKSFQAVMKLIDKPITESTYQNGDYFQAIRMGNSFFKNQTYEDSDIFSAAQVVDKDRDIQLTSLTEQEYEELRKVWGSNYTEEDYEFLMNKYRDYENDIDIRTVPMQNAIRNIVLVELQMRKDGGNNAKLQDQWIKLLNAAGISPHQETQANANNQNTFGTFIRQIEDERPIGKPDPEFEDVDGIGKYIRTWFTGMMTKSLGVTNPFQKEFDLEIEKYTVTPTEYDEDGD